MSHIAWTQVWYMPFVCVSRSANKVHFNWFACEGKPIFFHVAKNEILQRRFPEKNPRCTL